jgi:hypothetical protein
MNGALKMDSLNSLSAILNTKHDISHISEPLSLGRTKSCAEMGGPSFQTGMDVKNMVSGSSVFQNTLLSSNIVEDVNCSPKPTRDYIRLFKKLAGKVGHKFYNCQTQTKNINVEISKSSALNSQNKIDEFGESNSSSKINDMSSADSDSHTGVIRIPTKRMPLKVTSPNICVTR